jgi:hypothetical protein
MQTYNRTEFNLVHNKFNEYLELLAFFGFCRSYDVLKLGNTTFPILDLLPSSGKWGKTHTPLGTLEGANLNHWIIHIILIAAI